MFICAWLSLCLCDYVYVRMALNPYKACVAKRLLVIVYCFFVQMGIIGYFI